MKVGSKQIEVPDECPKNCPGYFQSAGQGNVCCRCPIFNCRLVIVDKDDPYMGGHADFRLIEPEDFSNELAEYYKEMFDTL